MTKGVSAEDDAHSDEYYLEMADEASDSATGSRRREQPGAQGQTTAASAKKLRHVRPGDSDVTLPFMQQSLDWMYSQQAWHGQPHGKKSAASEAPHYNCAELSVPLCYDGVCESDETIDVFVKRVVAAGGALDPARRARHVLDRHREPHNHHVLRARRRRQRLHDGPPRPTAARPPPGSSRGPSSRWPSLQLQVSSMWVLFSSLLSSLLSTVNPSRGEEKRKLQTKN
jgi:hypothetical protein